MSAPRSRVLLSIMSATRRNESSPPAALVVSISPDSPSRTPSMDMRLVMLTCLLPCVCRDGIRGSRTHDFPFGLLCRLRTHLVGAGTLDQAPVEPQAGFHVFQELRRNREGVSVFDSLLCIACSHPRSGDGCYLPRPNPCFSFCKGQGAGFLDRSYCNSLQPVHTIQERLLHLGCFSERDARRQHCSGSAPTGHLRPPEPVSPPASAGKALGSR